MRVCLIVLIWEPEKKCVITCKESESQCFLWQNRVSWISKTNWKGDNVEFCWNFRRRHLGGGAGGGSHVRYDWEPFERYVVKSYCSAQLKLSFSWQQREVATIPDLPQFSSHTAAIIQNLWLSSEKGMQSWLKINFRDIRKNQKASTVPTGLRGLCVREGESERGRERGRDVFFFPHGFAFPFAEGNQPTAPESLLLAGARSWSCSEPLVMRRQVASN